MAADDMAAAVSSGQFCSVVLGVTTNVCVCVCVCVCESQSCPTLCDPMDCSPPGSSVHGILQVRILEWVAILFSRGSSQPRDRTQISYIAVRFLIVWATSLEELPNKSPSAKASEYGFYC